MNSPPHDHDRDLARDRDHLIHSLHQRAAQDRAHIWTAGRGAILVDDAGREFLDALAGLWNVLVGHGREELAAAAAKQMSTLAYASAYAGGTTRPAIELAERLAAICYPSIDRFFFTSGGAEANEAAFKTARYYWKQLGRPDKIKIVSRDWAYHGTTLAAMSATGIRTYWPMFEPRAPGFLHIASPYPYRFRSPVPMLLEDNRTGKRRTPGEMAADLLEEIILREGADTIAAFIGEPVQGAGGVIVPPDDYWPRIRAICDRHDVLLITDEVITGFGRTASPRAGSWFALSQYGVAPDIVTFAKGITSGYFPLGGMGVVPKIAATLDAAPPGQTWMHAHTYSAHPVGCAVALANLDLLEREGLIERGLELGARLRRGLETLRSHPHVGDVRGLGSLAAVEFVADKSTKAEFPPEEKIGPRIHEATQRRGMVTRLRGDIYNFAPSYAAREVEIDRMVQTLADAVTDVLG